jgi:hypothetical protein
MQHAYCKKGIYLAIAGLRVLFLTLTIRAETFLMDGGVNTEAWAQYLESTANPSRTATECDGPGGA